MASDDSKRVRDSGSSPTKPSTLSPFRYPGGKSRLRPRVVAWLRGLGWRPQHFVEPFAGGGSIALAVAELDLADHVTLVELDPDVAAVWRTILGSGSVEFAYRIRNFVLTEDSAKKALEQTEADLVSRAFRCLLRNRIQRGGIMAPGAGFLKRGENDKGISSRWYPETLAKRIEQIHALRAKLTFREEDGLKVLKSFAPKHRVAAFVDPPYIANGKGAGVRLYRYHEVDSVKLFKVAQQFSGPMIITYHRSEIVRRQAEAIKINCQTVSVRTAHSVKRRELIMYKTGKNGSAGFDR